MSDQSPSPSRIRPTEPARGIDGNFEQRHRKVDSGLPEKRGLPPDPREKMALPLFRCPCACSRSRMPLCCPSCCDFPCVTPPSVRSRRDLVGKVFLMHYEPRLRDNERRKAHDKPLRGGPYDAAEQQGPTAL